MGKNKWLQDIRGWWVMKIVGVEVLPPTFLLGLRTSSFHRNSRIRIDQPVKWEGIAVLFIALSPTFWAGGVIFDMNYGYLYSPLMGN